MRLPDLKIAETVVFMSMFDIILDHLIGDVPGGSDEVPDGPKVATPVPFVKFREFLLDFTGSLALDILYESGNREIRRDRDIDVDMVRRHLATDDFHLIFSAYLPYQITGADADVAHQDRIAVLRDPDDMVGAVKRGVAGFAIVLHIPAILSC